MKIPKGDIGKYDPSEILSRTKLRQYLIESMCKLGYHILSFFAYLYTLVCFISKNSAHNVYAFYYQIYIIVYNIISYNY